MKRYRHTKTFLGSSQVKLYKIPPKYDSEKKQICTCMKNSMAKTCIEEYCKMRMNIFQQFRVRDITESPSLRTQISQRQASGVE